MYLGRGRYVGRVRVGQGIGRGAGWTCVGLPLADIPARGVVRIHHRNVERLELLFNVRVSATAGVRVCYPNPIALALILTLTLILALS